MSGKFNRIGPMDFRIAEQDLYYHTGTFLIVVILTVPYNHYGMDKILFHFDKQNAADNDTSTAVAI